MPVLPESMVWSAVCRVRGVVAAMVVVVVLLGPGCASSDDRGSGIDLGVGTTAVATSMPRGDDGVASPFVVRVASGYLRDLLDTMGPQEVDYGPLRGASAVIENEGIDVVVAGYLFDVVAGATEADVSAHRPLTSAQVERRLAELDERERSFESLGATEGDWLELESQRRAAIENQPRRRVDFDYSAYRVRVTEVFKGDISVGDVLDVQVFAGVNVASGWVAPVLEGTPRVVVAANWGSSVYRELRDPSGQAIDGVYWPLTDLFWLDEGVWDILVDDTSEGTSVVDETNTGEPGVPGSVPGGLVDDTPQLGVTVVTEENLTERPAPIPEAHFLAGLHELDRAWGALETLDDLAAALRTAAAEASGSSTTTTGSGTTP